MGTPLTGASNARGYEKIDDFRPISRYICECKVFNIVLRKIIVACLRVYVHNSRWRHMLKMLAVCSVCGVPTLSILTK